MDIALSPEILGYIAGFPVTNTFWVAVFISLLLIVIFYLGAKRLTEVPKGLQVWLEIIVDGSHTFINQTTQSATVTNRLHPFALTIFLLFIIGNLLSFIPGLSSVTYHSMPLYRTATTDYNLVFIVTFFFLIIIQMTTIASGGLWEYFKKFINPSSPLNFVLGLFDIIGEFAKLISLSFRFFGNAFAGEVLIAVLLFIFPYVLPAPFMGLLLLSSIVQPAVFALLVMVYIQMAIFEKESEPQKVSVQ